MFWRYHQWGLKERDLGSGPSVVAKKGPEGSNIFLFPFFQGAFRAGRKPLKCCTKSSPTVLEETLQRGPTASYNDRARSVTVYTPRDHTPLALLIPNTPRLLSFPNNLEVLTKSPGRKLQGFKGTVGLNTIARSVRRNCSSRRPAPCQCWNECVGCSGPSAWVRPPGTSG